METEVYFITVFKTLGDFLRPKPVLHNSHFRTLF
jgi:hypothetical protein